MKFAYLLPVSSQPRYHKRVAALQALGTEAQVLAFERTYFGGASWPDGYLSLGAIEHGRYLRRVVPLARALNIVTKAIQHTDVLYAFGLDMLLLGHLAAWLVRERPKIIYEVADIREELLGRRIPSQGLRLLERFLVKHTDVVVVTSRAYVSSYFYGIQGLKDLHYHVVENKLDRQTLALMDDVEMCTAREGLLRIGYFGLIRCRRSLDILHRAVEVGSGRIALHLRGFPVGGLDLDRFASTSPLIDYEGPYVAPEDLPAMYAGVDMVWASYPYGGGKRGNWEWARTNRFYEACCFHRPMFAQKGTEDARVVEELGLGIGLDLSDVEAAANRIVNINGSDIELWRSNLRALPEDIYLLTSEHEGLIKAIQ